jgi:hypothetical protein
MKFKNSLVFKNSEFSMYLQILWRAAWIYGAWQLRVSLWPTWQCKNSRAIMLVSAFWSCLLVRVLHKTTSGVLKKTDSRKSNWENQRNQFKNKKSFGGFTKLKLIELVQLNLTQLKIQIQGVQIETWLNLKTLFPFYFCFSRGPSPPLSLQ